MPVGTYGAVKGAMSPAELAENGTRIVLGQHLPLCFARAEAIAATAACTASSAGTAPC